jgi:hypothetical protein
LGVAGNIYTFGGLNAVGKLVSRDEDNPNAKQKD